MDQHKIVESLRSYTSSCNNCIMRHMFQGLQVWWLLKKLILSNTLKKIENSEINFQNKESIQHCGSLQLPKMEKKNII